MLRVSWGLTELEKHQAGEILRLQARLDDAMERLHTSQAQSQKALLDAQERFLAFLGRGTAQTQALQDPLPPASRREYPGDRPNTEPQRPTLPLWAQAEVPTESPS